MDKIEVIEIDHYVESIECPICSETVAILPQDDEAILTPCDHTLFVATDYGYEYASDKYNDHVGVLRENDDFDEFSNIDAFTSKVSLKGSVKYASYTPSPGCLGVYYGFAP